MLSACSVRVCVLRLCCVLRVLRVWCVLRVVCCVCAGCAVVTGSLPAGRMTVLLQGLNGRHVCGMIGRRDQDRVPAGA